LPRYSVDEIKENSLISRAPATMPQLSATITRREIKATLKAISGGSTDKKESV